MYTRCPSCRSEISFEPPANKDSLPADYKHRIKCPSCGVTIGVKINQSPVTVLPPTPAPVAQQPVQQQTSPTQIINVYHTPVPKEQTAKEKKAAKRAAKKSGISRNIIMMIFSLVFVALNVVGYLLLKGTFTLPESFAWLNPATEYFCGISLWEMLFKDIEGFKLIFSNIKFGLISIIPMALFTLSGINFIVAFISAIGRKYGRAFNLIFSIIIGAAAAATLFYPFLLGSVETDLVGYFVDLIDAKKYLAIAGAAWGVLQFIFSLFFLKSLKRDKKKKKRN